MTQFGILFILIIGLFIVWFLLWKNHSISNKENSDRTFVLTTFVSTLAIIATVIASTLSSSNQINQLKLTLQASISNQQQQSVEQNQVVIVGNSEDMSVEEQLQQAELAFYAEQYQQMETIYLNSDLKDSAIRNNNLGYAYANGLYVVPNLEIAEFYFDKAIAVDFEPAYANKFRALMVQEKTTEAEKLICKWSKLAEHRLLSEYFDKNISTIYNGSVDSFFSKLASDERIAILKELLKNEYMGYLTSKYFLENNEVGGYLYNYEYISSTTIENEDSLSYSDIHTYKKYKRSVADEEFLNRFVSLEQ